jgi:hypothetical protein
MTGCKKNVFNYILSLTNNLFVLDLTNNERVSDIGDLSRFWLSCLDSLVLLLTSMQLAYVIDFQSFDFERTWWRFFQKRVVRTKFDIYVFINECFVTFHNFYHQTHVCIDDTTNHHLTCVAMYLRKQIYKHSSECFCAFFVACDL